MGFAAAWIWFLPVAQTYVASFFNYNGPFNFLNRPMVQVPWLNALPSRFEDPWGQVGFAVLVLFLVWAACRLLGFVRRLVC